MAHFSFSSILAEKNDWISPINQSLCSQVDLKDSHTRPRTYRSLQSREKDANESYNIGRTKELLKLWQESSWIIFKDTTFFIKVYIYIYAKLQQIVLTQLLCIHNNLSSMRHLR